MANVLLHIVEVVAIFTLLVRATRLETLVKAIKVAPRAQSRAPELLGEPYRTPVYEQLERPDLPSKQRVQVGEIYRRSPNSDPFDDDAELLEVKQVRENVAGTRYVQVQRISREVFEVHGQVQACYGVDPESVEEEDLLADSTLERALEP